MGFWFNIWFLHSLSRRYSFHFHELGAVAAYHNDGGFRGGLVEVPAALSLAPGTCGDKDNAQASYNKRTFPLPHRLTPESFVLEPEPALGAQVALTPFVGHNCRPCRSNAFALLVVLVAPILYAFIASSRTLHASPHTIATTT